MVTYLLTALTVLIALVVVALCYVMWCLSKEPFRLEHNKGEVIFETYHLLDFRGDQHALFSWHGWQVTLHKVLRADAPECFHTHAGRNYRWVLFGGYIEEVLDHDMGMVPLGRALKLCQPGYFSRVDHDYCHRFDSLLSGDLSLSLWFKGPVTHKVKLVGSGWQENKHNG